MATRRDFLRITPVAALAAIGVRPSSLRGSSVHPDPRPGVDGSAVLSRDDLDGFSERTKSTYDMVRKTAHIADGIGCSCGCSGRPGYRSLLTCFEAGGMAMGCRICLGSARLAYERFHEGDSLDEIRAAMDRRYG